MCRCLYCWRSLRTLDCRLSRGLWRQLQGRTSRSIPHFAHQESSLPNAYKKTTKGGMTIRTRRGKKRFIHHESKWFRPRSTFDRICKIILLRPKQVAKLILRHCHNWQSTVPTSFKWSCQDYKWRIIWSASTEQSRVAVRWIIIYQGRRVIRSESMNEYI